MVLTLPARDWQGFDSTECMRLVDQDQADMVVLDPGLTFIAGRFHSLVPIMQEVYFGEWALGGGSGVGAPVRAEVVDTLVKCFGAAMVSAEKRSP